MKKLIAKNDAMEKKQSPRFFHFAFRTALLFSFLFFVFLTSCQRNVNKQDKLTKAYLMSHLTTKEKVDLLGGINMSTKPIPRLGIPSIRMNDGPLGARWGRSTSFPSGIALASTWDTALVKRIGQGIGREVRGKGRNIILGPNVNIARNPLNGRTFEGFGEDPFLTSQMGVSYILGVQDEGIGTTVKHFVANSQEFHRLTIDERIDERTLREIYFPAFKAAVQKAHSLAVMSAYNKLNGQFCSANYFLLNEVLRKEWHFNGLIMSDWGGVHSTFPTVNNALDLEMPFGTYLNEKTLLSAIDSGKVKISTINSKVNYILSTAYKLKVLPKMAYPQHLIDSLINSKETQKDALQAAVEAIVLLKNEHHILPININGNKKLHIAVIGPNAAFARTVGGGSAEVHPIFAISPLSALQNALKDKAVIDYAPGILFQYPQPIAPAFFYQNDGVTKGLKAEFYNNDNFEGKPIVTKATQIDYRQGAAQVTPVATNPDFKGKFTVRWVGKIKCPATGDYTFNFHSNGKSVLFLNDKEVLKSGKTPYWMGRNRNTYKIRLEKGKMYDIKVEYHGNPYNQNMGIGIITTLNWRYPQAASIAHAVSVARKADIVLVFVGTSNHFESEGFDRKTLELPDNQDALIQKVVRANKNTVVIITSGAPVSVNKWINRVPAVLETWFDGEYIGTAITKILLGEENPSGKLPITFPKSLGQEPMAVQHYTDNDSLLTYSDGIYVGYRYFDTKHIKPMFPFGFGLSYTTFKYSNLNVSPDTLGGKHQVDVSYTITNTGIRSGAEVSQVYVHEQNPKIDRPYKELKGFARVDIEPGASNTVHLTLDKGAFQYFDPQKHAWVMDPGVFNILVGSSSEKILLTGIVNWK